MEVLKGGSLGDEHMEIKIEKQKLILIFKGLVINVLDSILRICVKHVRTQSLLLGREMDLCFSKKYY